jgi:murein DD-endopeptidase MepM/ murein hydrolase activator NlpD
MRWIAGLLLLSLVGLAGAYVAAGRTAPPDITIAQPGRVVGRTGTVDVNVSSQNGKLTALTIRLEQNGHSFPLYTLDPAKGPGQTTPGGGTIAQTKPGQLHITRPFGEQELPALESGSARIVVEATAPSVLNLRRISSSASKDFEIRLEPPQIAVVSLHHYINHGGTEFVVYRATPPDVASGVRVGTIEYPGYPLGGDPALHGAFFALLPDQDLKTPIVAFARDGTGAEATATFMDGVFEKPFKKSRIDLDDPYIDRVVPQIIQHSPEMNMTTPTDPAGMIDAFVRLNSELRRKNAEEIAAFAKKTSPTRLWQGAFVRLGNAAVESAFADYRTYVYKGKVVDHEVHLGFDLARTPHVPILAANAGVVLNASWLGIYGNCVIIDHGMGVQSLYGHLSQFDVKVGDRVTKGQQIGLTGMTGMAGGDHLHFTMLVGGQMVNPIEWWDPHWIEDRIARKLREGTGS